MGLQIVKFSSTHVSQVAAIETASFGDPWSEDSFREIQLLSDTSWVALTGETVVGYLITQWVLDEIHILNIAVRADHRRQGIASQFLNMLFAIGAQRGMRDMFLEVRVSNLAAQSLYRQSGFSVLAARKAYYPDGEDAYVMYRRLEIVPDQTEPSLIESKGDVYGN